VFVTHDQEEALTMSDRIVVMYLGKIVEIAGKHSLYDNPMHPYTQALLSAIPVPVINQEKKRQVLQGEVPSPINKPKGCAFHTRCPHCMDICREMEPRLAPNPEDPEHMCACHMFTQKKEDK
jgi:oligopeptide/dipeptide ABC transporter ATP-binding protein